LTSYIPIENPQFVDSIYNGVGLGSHNYDFTPQNTELSGIGSTIHTVRDLMELGNYGPIYSQDFEDGTANGWTVLSGTWNINAFGSTKVYRTVKTDALARSYVGDSSWSKYTLESMMYVGDWNTSTPKYAGLIGRLVDNNNYYMFLYESGMLKIKKKVSGNNSTIASKIYALNTGTWYTFRAVMDNNKLTLFVNDQEELEVIDTQFSSGKAGLVSAYAETYFDNFSIR
jgi:hypothetical protein